tara:strand:+ start:155 stop:370 length:216 start_codon:yes stop_codon:yes gene_type:complete
MRFNLSTLKAIFFNKKRFNKLDRKFIKWNVKMKDIKEKYKMYPHDKTVIRKAREFLGQLKFDFKEAKKANF